MSATAASIDTPQTRSIADVRPGLGRLTAVELRKMTDTRAGFWLPIAVAGITLIVVVISVLAGTRSDHTVAKLFDNAIAPGTFLLPVMGILLVCGEWTQRTTLQTFTLTPSRPRVVWAKVLASIVLSIGALIVCVALSFLFAGLLSDAPGGAGGLSLAIVGQGAIRLATSMLMGIGFGAAILVSAPAIVAYLLLPTIWAALAGSIHSLERVGRWLDASSTLDPLTQHAFSPTDWVHAAATLAVWMALPLAIGIWRVLRRDVS